VRFAEALQNAVIGKGCVATRADKQNLRRLANDGGEIAAGDIG